MIEGKIATILVGLIILLVFVRVIIFLIQSKKEGQSSCSALGCESCPVKDTCHAERIKK